MKARINPILAAIGAFFALTAALVIAGSAVAGGCGCSTSPTPPTQHHDPCCQPPSINVNIPGVNVNVGASVIVNANVQAQASVSGSGSGAVYVNGGGGGGGYLMPGTPGLIQGLNVDGGLRRTAYEATRTKITKVVIEAVCLDDKDVPHPASQVTPDRDIEDSYDGELYRCIAGTRMQYTFAEFNGKVAFDHGQTVTCQKNDALYHTPGAPGSAGGAIECRPQKPARDCNERSLLRRFGAGVKVLTLVTIEKYTAYREETTGASTTSALSLDGGVGGVMY
ncbi:MAG: hypothetical protein P4L73_07490 [Caulobacteraceae bacterium]|nr:hypothetical protein [Caulobacteraceae bacterium]